MQSFDAYPYDSLADFLSWKVHQSDGLDIQVHNFLDDAEFFAVLHALSSGADFARVPALPRVAKDRLSKILHHVMR